MKPRLKAVVSEQRSRWRNLLTKICKLFMTKSTTNVPPWPSKTPRKSASGKSSVTWNLSSFVSLKPLRLSHLMFVKSMLFSSHESSFCHPPILSFEYNVSPPPSLHSRPFLNGSSLKKRPNTHTTGPVAFLPLSKRDFDTRRAEKDSMFQAETNRNSRKIINNSYFVLVPTVTCQYRENHERENTWNSRGWCNSKTRKKLTISIFYPLKNVPECSFVCCVSKNVVRAKEDAFYCLSKRFLLHFHVDASGSHFGETSANHKRFINSQS